MTWHWSHSCPSAFLFPFIALISWRFLFSLLLLLPGWTLTAVVADVMELLRPVRLSLRILQEKAAVVRLALTILNSDSNWTKYSDNIFPKGPNSSSGYFQSDWLCYFPAHDHCNKGFLHAAFHKPRQLPEKRQYFPTIITPHYSKRNSTLSETA